MRRKLFIISMFIFLAFTGAVALNYLTEPHAGKTDPPHKVAAAFLEALKDQDENKLSALVTDDSQTMISMFLTTVAMADNEAEKKAMLNWGKVQKCQEEGATAQCHVCCDVEGNSTDLSLKKVDGHWLVLLEKE